MNDEFNMAKVFQKRLRADVFDFLLTPLQTDRAICLISLHSNESSQKDKFQHIAALKPKGVSLIIDSNN